MLPAPFGRAGSARAARVVAPLAVAGGAATELVVLGNLNGQLAWATPLVLVLAGGCSLVLSLRLASAAASGGARTGPCRAAGGARNLGRRNRLGTPPTGPSRRWSSQRRERPRSGRPRRRVRARAPGARPRDGAGSLLGLLPVASAAPAVRALPGRGPGRAPDSARGSASLTAAVRYVNAHGGGTIAVSSQSSAASVIVSSGANVAGIGGFPGRESSVIAVVAGREVRAGRLRWILAETGGGTALPGDTRTGSQSAIEAVRAACPAVKIPTGSGSSATIYDCLGHAAAVQSGSSQKAGHG